jgi:hypothetical protein
VSYTDNDGVDRQHTSGDGYQLLESYKGE